MKYGLTCVSGVYLKRGPEVRSRSELECEAGNVDDAIGEEEEHSDNDSDRVESGDEDYSL